MKTLFRPLPRLTTISPRWPRHDADCSCYETTRTTLFPKHIIPHDFVAFLRAHTRVPAAYAAMAAVAIVRAGLGGQFALERARAAMIACVLRTLHFHTPQSMMSMRGAPIVRDRCHACRTWAVSRWGISDTHGGASRALIDTYVEGRIKDGVNRPPPSD